MATIEDVLDQDRPASVAEARANWPRRDRYFPSPVDWRDECLYFLLPDRFADGAVTPERLLDRHHLDAARTGQQAPWDDAMWLNWARSGRARFQGGTLRGVIAQLDYLEGLNVTTLWLGPVWKQRRESFPNDENDLADEYHGYAVQDFLEVDPRFGTRRDLVDLVAAAHARKIRVIFDVIVNHSARNWLYAVDGNLRPLSADPPLVPGGPRYGFGAWLDGDGVPMAQRGPFGPDDAVWPAEVRDPGAYNRRGQIQSWGDGHLDLTDAADFRVGDMVNRDFDLDAAVPGRDERVLDVLIACWTYWISLTDCDGFRIDTLKHITVEQARSFCRKVKEHAENLGKNNFLLVGEVAGGAEWERSYLDQLEANLDAALAIGGERDDLRRAARGDHAEDYLDRYTLAATAVRPAVLPATHRVAGACFVTSVDDHDDVGDRQRFPVMTHLDPFGTDEADADSFFHPLANVPACALLLFTLGIPCLYYGMEQGLAAAAKNPPWAVPHWHEDRSGGDRYLREALFGPLHPRRLGPAGRPGRSEPGAAPADPSDGRLFDPGLPGFGPFGTAGRHLLDPTSPMYLRIAAMLAARTACPPLRLGEQYPRRASVPGSAADTGQGVGGIVAWARILHTHEVAVVVNTNRPVAGGPALDLQAVDAQVLVDGSLHPDGSVFRSILSTAGCEKSSPQLDVGTAFPVGRPQGGPPAVAVPGLRPLEVVVLARDALS